MLPIVPCRSLQDAVSGEELLITALANEGAWIIASILHHEDALEMAYLKNQEEGRIVRDKGRTYWRL